LTGQASTFARRDVLDALARQLPVGASAERTLAQLEELADEFLASERAVPVTVDRGLEERRYSTPELLALERGLVEQAERRGTEGTAMGAGEHVRATLQAGPAWTPLAHLPSHRELLVDGVPVLAAAVLQPALHVIRQALTPEQVALVAGHVRAGFRPAA
jgi:hypothetical protein